MQAQQHTPTILTGINTTGAPHLGNYVGAIRPAIQSTQKGVGDYYFFLADWHALIKCHDPKIIAQSSKEIAATWLACGLDPEQVVFYRQSKIAAIAELNWLLNCVCAKGLMNRAHAYKAAQDVNREAGQEDIDHGISMGLFCYPVLMSADILLFGATHVPVGRDQIQHLEMARDIAGRFNHRYAKKKPILRLPTAVVDENVPLLMGTDGRKMSKSYDNTIALFLPEKALRKNIMKIVTNSQAPGEPKNPDESNVFSLYQAFASEAEVQTMRQAYLDGISWGDAKQALFERINQEIAPMREKYETLLANPAQLEEILQKGEEKARAKAGEMMEKIRTALGYQAMS